MSSSNLFGGYRSQTTYALQQISSSRYPDTNKDFERNIARLNQFVDYIASYLQTMQKGVDQANEDPITKLRSTVLDLGILLGGGELLYGINLGDLQYWLPALGAMFGFDSNQPLPLNLLYAAEHFFLGFIIPLDAWAPAVEDVIDGWAVAFGLPADFVASLHDLLDAIQSLTSDYLGLFNALWGILTIFNTLPGVDQGPFADLWSAVRTLLSGQGISALGSVVDPVFHSLAPWIEDLAILLNDWDTVVKAFTGGIYNAQSMVNLATMFASFTNMIPSGTFSPLTAWLGIFTGALTPAGIPGLDASKIVSGTFAAPLLQPLINAISQGFGGSSGLNFTSLQSFIAGIPSAQATIDKIYDTIMGVSTTGHSLTDLGVALATFPANFIQGVLTGGNIPNLDASKITTGTFLQALLPSITSGWGKTIDSSVLVNAISQALIPSLTSGWGGTIASSLLSGVLGQALIPSLTSGWGGTIASSLLAGVLGAGLIPALDTSKITTGTFGTAFVPWAAAIDTLVHAWGGIGSSFTPTDLITFASAIPHDNLTGNLGGSNIANTIQIFLDAGIKAIQNNNALPSQSIAQWNNTVSALMGFIGYNPAGATPPNSVADITSKSDATLKARAVSKKVSANIDQSLDASFDIMSAYAQATLPTIALTQASTVAGYITTDHGGTKQTVEWEGYVSSGTLTGFYVNLYSVDTSGVWHYIVSSADLHLLLATGSTPQRNFWSIPALNYINSAQGNNYVVELLVTGTGTYTLIGNTYNSNVKAHPTAIPAWHGAARGINPVSYGATGAGYTRNTSGTTIAGSWSHTANAGDGVVVFVDCGSNTGVGAHTAWTRKASYGSTDGTTNTGTLMTSLGVIDIGSGFGWVEAFGLLNAPAGAKTVAVSVTGGSGTFVTAAANSFSYPNVASFGAAVTSGPTTSTAMTSGAITTAPAGSMVVQAFQAVNGGAHCTLSAPNHNSRWIQDQLNGAWGTGTAVNDAPGAASVTFTETDSSSSGYVSLAIPLNAAIVASPSTVANPNAIGGATYPAAYTLAVPWVGLSGIAGATSYSPVTDAFATPGSGQSIQNPAVKYPWANYHDIVMCSDGSGGEGGGYPVGGVGGKAGTWTKQTLTKAQMGTSNLTLNIGGGSAGTSPGVGSSATGNGVSAVVPGWGTVSQTGAPGSGSGLSPSAYGVPGDSAANFTYTDANGTSVTFNGGPGGGSGGQAPGSQPGGGGSGGNSTYMPNFNGGPGGAAEVWIRSYQ